ncbi:MAG: stage III sporulation protein AA [Lachnospiraceae bacterium]
MRDGIELIQLFPDYLRSMWRYAAEQVEHLQEIRLRVQQPIMLLLGQTEYYLQSDGRFLEKRGNPYFLSAEDLRAILNHLCQYSLYAYEDELKQGFFTIKGGHRIGVAGQVVMEAGLIKNIKYISCVNIRIAHEVRGAADKVLPYLYQSGELLNAVIISSPGCGKTTLLRDIVRQVSDGNPYGIGRNVGVVDERSEIGGSFLGIPQNDIGSRTDLLDTCPKAQGMMMLIRSMSPKVVAVDEIGSEEDLHALQQVLQCGCRILATVHGESLEEVRRKVPFQAILEEKVFQRFIILGHHEMACRVMAIYDENYSLCLN